MLDPKTLTPEQLYKLQSETWAQGAEYERERIIQLLEDYIPTFYQLSDNTDAGKYPIEHLIDLIKGEQK